MSAGLIVSIASTKRIVYHRPGCMYAKRMKPKNKMSVSAKTILGSPKYCPCKYCSGLRGDVRIRKQEFDGWIQKLQMHFLYDQEDNRLFIRTGIGLWKVVPSPQDGHYWLFHLNHFSSDASIKTMANWNFHRQKDVKPTDSLPQLIHYIDQHDRAKVIMQEDYHKLPRATKKQKKYYKQAERREHRNSCRRLDSIFDQIEREMKLDSRSAGIQLRQTYSRNAAAYGPFSGLAS